jgi:hypothetical protein
MGGVSSTLGWRDGWNVAGSANLRNYNKPCTRAEAMACVRRVAWSL